jgi:iron complex outermembrane receptor protein
MALRFLAALLVIFSVVPSLPAQVGSATTADIGELKKLAIEDLLNLEITSVSRQPERLADAASAIQVITSEDIRRSGAASLAEALRLATNLQVARLNGYNWAISARGFNATTANKLLVMIDGRTVYTPLFSGVFWDAQHVMLEDIERIEVISGPGATLWGSNAVNGVINVITKAARDTQGALLSAGGGSFLRAFGNGRYGGKIGEDVHYRVYGMGFNHENSYLRGGAAAADDWHLGQGGFRADMQRVANGTLTVQGDFYAGAEEINRPQDLTIDGQNLLARWTRPLAEDNALTVQVYWDRTHRRNPGIFSEQLNTYDLDLQHHFRWGQRQRLVWGANYRLMDDRVLNGPLPNLGFLPSKRTMHLASGFIQDEISLFENQLLLTFGSKFEYNSFSGFEVQPSFRLAWSPAAAHTFWGAISRAVRTPSRIDADLRIPRTAPFLIRGSNDFNSETVIAYELGYRTEIAKRATLSLSAFYNDYDELRSVEPIAGAPGQFIISNELAARTYGLELAVTWQPMEWWRLRGGYTLFKKRIRFGDSQDFNNGRGEGNDPHHQFLVHSMLNLPWNVEFDAVLRYVDNLNQRGPLVPSYVSLDLRLGWRPTPNWEFAIVGQDLVEKRHTEFVGGGPRQEIPRSVYGKVTWRFWTGENGGKAK